MLIGLFSLHARSISCCAKRSRFFFLPGCLVQGVARRWRELNCSPEDELCLCARTVSGICASKCECLLSVLLSAIQRKMMLGKLLRGRRCIWEHLPARRSRIGLELGCKSDLLQNYASGALLAMKSLSMSEALPMGGTRKERRSAVGFQCTVNVPCSMYPLPLW